MGKDEGLSLSCRYLPPPSPQTADPLFASCTPINWQSQRNRTKNTKSNSAAGKIRADMGLIHLVVLMSSRHCFIAQIIFGQFSSFLLICPDLDNLTFQAWCEDCPDSSHVHLNIWNYSLVCWVCPDFKGIGVEHLGVWDRISKLSFPSIFLDFSPSLFRVSRIPNVLIWFVWIFIYINGTGGLNSASQIFGWISPPFVSGRPDSIWVFASCRPGAHAQKTVQRFQIKFLHWYCLFSSKM